MIIIMRTGCGSSAVKTPLILAQCVSCHLTSMILTKRSPMSVHQTTSSQQQAQGQMVSSDFDVFCEFIRAIFYYLFYLHTAGSFTAVEVKATVLLTVSGRDLCELV